MLYYLAVVADFLLVTYTVTSCSRAWYHGVPYHMLVSYQESVRSSLMVFEGLRAEVVLESGSYHCRYDVQGPHNDGQGRSPKRY